MSDLTHNQYPSMDGIAALLENQRDATRIFTEGQQERLGNLESLVANEIDDIHESIKGWGQFEAKVRELHESVEAEAVQVDQRRVEVEDLKRSVDENETERLAELDQEVQAALQERDQLRDQLESEADEAEKMRLQITELESELEADAKALEIRIQSNADERKSLLAKLETATEEQATLKSQIDEAANLLRSSEKEIEDLQEQASDLEKQAEQQQQQTKEAQGEIESLNLQIQAEQESQKEAATEYEKLHRQMEEATEWLGDRKQQISHLESQVDELKSDAERYRNQYELEAQALKKARSERDALKESVSTESSEGKQLRAMLNEATKSLNDRESEVEKLQNKLSDLSAYESETQSLKGKLSQAIEELDEAQSAAEAIKKDRDSLTEEAKETIEDRDRKIASLKDQISKMATGGAEADQFRGENAELKSQLEKAATAVKKARSERDRLREQIAGGSEGERELQAKLRNTIGKLQERDERIQQLEESNAKLSENPSTGGDEQEYAALKRRFEAAATKVGQLKTQNEQLEEELADALEGSVAADSERLKHIEASYEKRIRAAEVEMSLDRAQSARAQTELKERVRDLEFQLAKAGGGTSPDDDAPRKPRSLRESMGLD